MLTDRQKTILTAIIEQFVRTNEPVGSKLLTELPEFMLGISSATIRNEMAYLEEQGYLLKTHTSSGRVPSEEGYRFYVNEILNNKSIKSVDYEDSFPLVDEILERNLLSREQAIHESMALVADLTHYTSVAMGSSGVNARIRKLQFVPLYGKYAVILMVTDKGNVESKKIIIPDMISNDEVEKVIIYLNKILYDCPISDIYERIRNSNEEIGIRDYIAYYDELIAAFVRTLTNMAKDDVFMSGKNNIFSQPEFKDTEKIKEILTTIEDEDFVKAVSFSDNSIQVRIGNENELSVMKDCSVVSVPYELDNGEVGRIAVIGPMRMEYQKIIPLLEYIAKNIKKLT
ncbi:MAG: heat-inducible transcriptional repressor HrcA [Coprobacillus sp.]|nr:heat-inducible transcriptional repressor HrcA [Coprobacillus sp.]MDY4144980.1 heat-inducible transcriptional repressor HrcA [Bacilli bacterium]CCY06899.1 heat-inducible transcription repressor hrcA [Coprobacillus sp. CAG:698]